MIVRVDNKAMQAIDSKMNAGDLQPKVRTETEQARRRTSNFIVKLEGSFDKARTEPRLRPRGAGALFKGWKMGAQHHYKLGS